MAAEAKQFVVTASDDSHPLWSQVWHPKHPLGVGYPFRWILEKTETGVRVRDIGAKIGEVLTEPFKDLSISDLKKPVKLDGTLQLRIEPIFGIEHAKADTWRPEPILGSWRSDDKKPFRTTLTAVIGSSVVIMIAILLMPQAKPKTEELIPEQFAKVILKPAFKTKPVDTRSSGSKSEKNVVHAFRSDAVKKTTSALFSAGAAKSLLNSSKLMDVAGSAATIKKVFGARTGMLGQSKEQAGNTYDPSASKVGLIGGGGGRGTGAAGYGTGAGGAVAGQGSGQVGFATEGVGIDEGLTKDEVGRVIRQHINEIRYCYESAMIRSPGLEGKMTVTFTIRGNGTVKTAGIKETSGDRGLDECITTHLMRWQFPKPRGGADVGVSYPFIFKSLGG